MTADAGKAVAFVRASGSARDRALLQVLLGEPLTDAELEAVREGQNPDGGFRVKELSTQASVVGRTAEMLLYFGALGAADFGCAQAAADFLIERQRPDGTWGEDDSLAAASMPPHFRPGSDDVAGWETAAGVLALTGVGLPLDFHAPLEWILHNRVPVPGAHLFRIEPVLGHLALARHQGGDSPGAQRTLPDVLAAQDADLEVFELNFALLGCRAAGLGPPSPLVAAWGRRLASLQKAEGGFGSGPAPSGFETVLSLASLEHAGLVKLPRASRALSHEADPAKSDHGI
jgi:hypothetical protein